MARTWTALGVLAALGVGSTGAQPLDGREPIDDIFYHFMPIAWRDSDNDIYRLGDFDGMTASLDYLEELGVTAVWMNPIFPSPAYHGYQHGPGDQLNPWFGSEADFLNFVQQAHARGIKVFIDFVVYGINRDYQWFQDAYNNPSSQYDDWLAFENAQNTTYLGSTFTTWNGSTVRHIHWDLRTPEVFDLVTGWSQYWLDPNDDGDPSDGIDGYRLDHVWEWYPNGPDGWGYNTSDFWVPWHAALETVNPDVFTFAEQAQWGSYGVELLPGQDATMTKPFEFAARDALANESAAPLYNEMAVATSLVPAGKLFVGIIGDHDVDRLTSVIGGSLQKARAAAAVLLTQPFPPIIYYGDEIGMLGFKGGSCGGDAVDIPMREPFKWNAVAGPPMTNYWAQNPCSVSSAYSQDNDGRSVEEQLGVPGSLLEEYKLLIATRKAHVALRRGSYHAVENDNAAVWAFLRHQDGEETLLVMINLDGSAQIPVLDLSNATIPGGTTTVQDIITSAFESDLTDVNKAAYPVSVPAYGYRIFAVTLTPGAPPVSEIDGANIPTDFGLPGWVATQDNATGLGDNVSELNELYVLPDDGGLRIGVSGNSAQDGTGLCLLFDTTAGGQNTLRLDSLSPPPYSLVHLDGLQFDAGFAPDQFIFANAFGTTLYIDQIELTDAGDTPKTYRGSTGVNSGNGILSGGSNPLGMQMALNNTNTAGVTDVDASAAGTATTGVELFVPYDYIELDPNTVDEFTMVVFIVASSGSVGNQWLPGLGGGQANLGFAPDLTTVPDEQFITVLLDRAGDLNCDGVIDFGDINPFVDALTNRPYYDATWPGCIVHGDIDGDDAVGFGDINPFVDLLLGR